MNLKEFANVEAKALGIEALKSFFAAVIAWYDLFKAVYLDDKKFKTDDLIDLVSAGPVAIQKTIIAADNAPQYDDEAKDLDDDEIAELEALAGTRLEDPRFQDMLKGFLYIIKGGTGFKKKAA